MENIKKTIVLKLTKDCNLQCKYCYERNRNVPENNLRDIKPSKIIRILNQNSKNCDFLFLLHGGEPLLMGKEEFKEVIKELENAKSNNNVFELAIQTNGTLLYDEWIDLLDSASEFLGEREIGISIDRPEFINDSARVTKNNTGSFQKIIRNIDKLKKAKFLFGLLFVIGRHNLKYHNEINDFIQSIKPNFVRFLPCSDFDSNGQLKEFSISPFEFTIFLENIYDSWLADNRSEIILDPIASIISNLTDSNTNWCEYMYQKCNNFLIIETNCLIGACDNWQNNNIYLNEKPISELSEFELDDIFSFNNLNFKKIDDRVKNLMSDCESCSVFNNCRGGCVATRHFYKTEKESFYKEYCVAKKRIITKIENSLMQL